MTYPVLKRHQIFVDIDRRHIAYWKSRENGISKVSPPPQRAAIHIYVSEVQSRQGAISHLRVLHGPKWLRVLAVPIGVAFSSYLGPENISSELDDRDLARASVWPCHTASSSKVPVVELWRDFFWAQVRREGKCEPSSDDPVTGHIGKFCHRGCGSGAGGGIAITETCHQRCFGWCKGVNSY